MSNKNLIVQIPDGSIPEAKLDAKTVAKWDAKVDTTDLPNIKKNPNATDGDIIDTHMTIGYRKGDAAIHSFVLTAEEEYANEASDNSTVALCGRNNAACAKHTLVLGGNNNTVTNFYSLILNGQKNNISSNLSVVINGQNNNVTGNAGLSLNGNNNNVLGFQTKSGHFATDGTAAGISGTKGDAFIIGNGTADDARSNAFRIAFDGNVYGMSAFNSTGADYAEYFEWADGNPDNEDRRGLFVTLDGDKIKIAGGGDEVIGVISAAPSVIGNAYDDQWQGMYLTDVFGQPLTHMVHHEAEYIDVEVPDTDEDGNELDTTHTEKVCIHGEYDAEEHIVNPDYDPTQKYIPRSQRKEWAVVGMFGQLIVVDDGSCSMNGYCSVSDNGVGTSTENGYRVLKRLDENHIKILFK